MRARARRTSLPSAPSARRAHDRPGHARRRTPRSPRSARAAIANPPAAPARTRAAPAPPAPHCDRRNCAAAAWAPRANGRLCRMAAQLQLVQGDPPPEALASVRADARLRLWGAALCAMGALVFTAFGYRRTVLPVLAGPIAAAFLLWAGYLLATFADRRAVRYTLTPERLEIEKGIFGRRIESVELWRIRDVVLDQTLFERLRGVGRITVYSSDQVEPQLDIGPVPGARILFDRLREAIAAVAPARPGAPATPGAPVSDRR